VPAILRHRQGKEGGAGLLSSRQHAVPVHGVECAFPVNLDHDAAGAGSHAGGRGVANNLAPTWDVYSDLQRRHFASGVWAGGQGTQCCEPVPNLTNCDWADSDLRLGNGKEDGRGGELREGALDDGVHKPEHRHWASSLLVVAAFMCS
jgi:hypothetical protein